MSLNTSETSPFSLNFVATELGDIGDIGDIDDIDDNIADDIEQNIGDHVGELYEIDNIATDLNLDAKYDYRIELNKLKQQNKNEYRQLQDNLKTVQEIIDELKQKAEKISKDIKSLDIIQSEALSMFSEISRKKF
jgi:hypothetical protein